MADLDDIALGLDSDGKPVIGLGPDRFDSIDALARKVPEINSEGAIDRYCDAVNHLAAGYDYRVIHDPDHYRASYGERRAAEDPDVPWQEGVARLSDFGDFDLAQIAPPAAVDGNVEFFVEDSFYGLPYRVVAKPGEAPTYDPLPLKD